MPLLTVEELNEAQLALYQAIMRGRASCSAHPVYSPTTPCKPCRNQAGALCEVERATKYGELESELEWWEPATTEPIHKASSLALVIALRD
jgi:hypothetical protein